MKLTSNIAIALDDSWGNGKTFFVKQTQMVLQSFDLSDENPNEVKECMKKFFKRDKARNYLPVYYDVWSNDSDIDPILSIVFKMLQEIDGLGQYEVTDKKWWDRFTTGLEIFTTTFAGFRVKDFLNSVKGKNPLEEIQKHRESDQILNKLFDVLLEKQPPDTRIVFFIDELDRCCPNFAVRLLERIKHYFLHEKIIFVLAINMSELQHTVKRHYGNDFNADKYLRRFFDFTIPLPSANMTKYYDTINFDDSRARNIVANSMIEKYNLSLREITRYLQYLKVAVPEKYNPYEPKYRFYHDVLIPFIIGLSVHDRNKYNDFLQGKDSSSFAEVIPPNHADWLCKILLRPNETFLLGINANATDVVSLAEKFQPVYECIFGDPTKSVRNQRYEVYSEDKGLIMDILSFMMAGQNNGTN